MCIIQNIPVNYNPFFKKVKLLFSALLYFKPFPITFPLFMQLASISNSFADSFTHILFFCSACKKTRNAPCLFYLFFILLFFILRKQYAHIVPSPVENTVYINHIFFVSVERTVVSADQKAILAFHVRNR